MNDRVLRTKLILLTDDDAIDLRQLRDEMNEANKHNWENYLQMLPDVFDGHDSSERIEELEAVNPKLRYMNKRLNRHYGQIVRGHLDRVAEEYDEGYVADIHMLLDTLPGIANMVLDFQQVGDLMPLPT